ncbi:MAG: MBL fold metallo-hydrolase [Halobacteriales archaeon]
MRVSNLTRDSLKFTSNAFLVEPDGEGSVVLVDAGADGSAFDGVDRLDRVVLTHTHHDHVDALDGVVERFDVDVWGYDVSLPYVDRALEDGDVIEMGGGEFTVLYTPGHKDDHVCLYCRDEGVLFSGDLVFPGGAFGRTDLQDGDRDVLVDSIRRLVEHVGDGPLREMHAGHEPSVHEDVDRHLRASLRNAERMG